MTTSCCPTCWARCLPRLSHHFRAGLNTRGHRHPTEAPPLVPWAQFCWPDTSSATDKNSWPPVRFPSFLSWCLPAHSTCGLSATIRRAGSSGIGVALALCGVIAAVGASLLTAIGWRSGIDHAQHHPHNLHGLCHSHRRGIVLAGVSRLGGDDTIHDLLQSLPAAHGLPWPR